MTNEIPTFSKTKIKTNNNQHYYRIKLRFAKGNKVEYKSLGSLRLWNRPETLSQKKTNELTKKKIEASIEAIKSSILEGKWFAKKNGDNNLFFDFFDNVVTRIRGGKEDNTKSSYTSTRRALKLFFKEYGLGDNPSLNAVNTKDVAREFKIFLNSTNDAFRGGKYSKSTQNAYYIRFAIALNDAFERKLCSYPQTKYVEAPKVDDPNITYLTDNEVEKLESSECTIPMLKNAFLFAVYTGLRKQDIEDLKWHNIIIEDNGELTLDVLTQKKKRKLSFKIPKQAYKYLPQRRQDHHRVFLGFRYQGHQNKELRQWVYQSGVSQEKANKVSSHVARHTFAVKFLKAKGNTLYALSKAMAHKSMKVTEYYYATYDKTSLDDAMARAFG